MRRRQITKSTISRYRLNRDYSKPFEQSLRRTLSKDERAVIYPLERARAKGIPGRFIILDSSGFDARPILIEYFNWLSADDSIIISRPNYPKLPASSRVRRFSWRRPNNIRSHTFRRVLILDTHRQKQAKVSELLQAVAGGVNTTPDTLVVIHATLGIKARIPQAYTAPDPPPELGVISIEAITEHVIVLSFSQSSQSPQSSQISRPSHKTLHRRSPR